MFDDFFFPRPRMESGRTVKARAVAFVFLLSLTSATSTLASSPTGPAFLAATPPASRKDVDALVQAVAMAKTKALSGRDVAIQGKLRVQLLLERHRQTRLALLAGQGELGRHQQAGSAAYRRHQTIQKTQGAPASIESLEIARTEFDAASKKASALVEQTLELTNIDDQMPQAVAQATDAAAEAKSAADTAHSSLVKLKSIADEMAGRVRLLAEEARKAAAIAQEEAGKARALAAGLLEGYRAKRAQADKDLARQKAQLAEMQKSLAEVQTSLTATRAMSMPSADGAKSTAVPARRQ
jgi:hypothetical protein